MATYYIKKTSNGEYKEIEKKLKLNVSKYAGDNNTLYFDVEGQDIPFLMDYNLFFNVMNEQIQKGLLETLDFNDGIIKVTIRDGNIIKKYTYDFSWNDFNNNLYSSNFDHLKRSIYKIVSIYKENPNSSIASEQKYIWLIYDILDGDRIPTIDKKEELLRLFEVYNAHKLEFLESLLANVIFCDDDGNIIDYRNNLRNRRIEQIRYDVFNQMEAAVYVFTCQNNANELYQEYLEKLYIPRREIVYKYVDEDGNEVEMAPEVEGGNIFSFAKDLLSTGVHEVLSRIKKKN